MSRTHRELILDWLWSISPGYATNSQIREATGVVPPVAKMWVCLMSLCPRWAPMNLLTPTGSDTMVVTDLGETLLPRSRQVGGLREGGLDAGIRRDRQGSSRAFA